LALGAVVREANRSDPMIITIVVRKHYVGNQIPAALVDSWKECEVRSYFRQLVSRNRIFTPKCARPEIALVGLSGQNDRLHGPLTSLQSCFEEDYVSIVRS
jgi:hypothetical protein